MPRRTLEERRIHSSVRDKIASYGSAMVDEVEAALAAHDVVVVGMQQNPFPRRARKLLDQRQIPHHYLEYGSYLSRWRDRLALKLWTGWATFPMIFVRGTLIGGFEDLKRLLDAGELGALLAAPPTRAETR
jgi:monothiol glutaredoxin